MRGNSCTEAEVIEAEVGHPLGQALHGVRVGARRDAVPQLAGQRVVRLALQVTQQPRALKQHKVKPGRAWELEGGPWEASAGGAGQRAPRCAHANHAE